MNIDILDINFINKLPPLPGVYRFLDLNHTVLYVGKAINLRKRVASYFKKNIEQSPRIAFMVKKIVSIEITITDNESSAFILENNLIKSLKPKYNIIFRDDKTYPLIRIIDHKFPKIDYYRGDTKNPNNLYFGPYPNAYSVKQNLDLIQKLFKLRTCSNAFFASRKRPCILFQIKRCTAPCVDFVSKENYAKQVQQTIDFLHGKLKNIINDLNKDMYLASEKENFELAASIRDQILLLNKIQDTQIITNHAKPLDCDVIVYELLEQQLFVYIITVRSGRYIGDNHYKLQISDNEWLVTLEVFLENYYFSNQTTKVVFINAPFDNDFKICFEQALKIEIRVSNAKYIAKLFAMGSKNLKMIINAEGNNYSVAASKLGKILNMKEINRIECIDISHNRGDSGIAAIVVYENGKIDNTQYRKYNLLKDINGNDLLAMEIVITKRLFNNELSLPDILLVDGGKLQLQAVKNIINKFALCDKIRVIAICKGERRDPLLDRLILDTDHEISYSKEPLILNLMQSLRDEAHRFAITGHRKKQIQKMSSSAIDAIPKVGIIKRKALIAHFGSVKALALASVEDLQQVSGIGVLLAKEIYAYFH